MSDHLRNALLRLLAPKRQVFVSYHHHGDRPYYDAFTRAVADEYEVVEDNSVEREIDSDDSAYVIRTIREKHITGSSCTVVLCGAGTARRKFVDWEIKATLDACHGLVGVLLPGTPLNASGKVDVPGRLYDNIASRYAIWTDWNAMLTDPVALKAAIEQANSRPKSLIRNSRALRSRNG